MAHQHFAQKGLLSPYIFREYDIRGLAGKELNRQSAETIGKAFGTHLHKFGAKRAVVGMDNRESSGEIAEGFIQGVSSTGIGVIDIGLSPSPMVNFAIIKLGADGGASITGSHNPVEYNGMKLFRGNVNMYGAEIRRLGEIANSGKFFAAKGHGAVEKKEIKGAYAADMKRGIKIRKKVKVAVDCGNGLGGLFVPGLFSAFGCGVVGLYCRLDGSFPNHLPDPMVEANLYGLKKAVVESGADLGIGLDGDCDRIGVVDEKGRIVPSDLLLAVFAKDVIAKNPHAKVVAEVRCSQAVMDVTEASGGKGIWWKAGHSLIKAKVRKERALLAGELSGHMFFADRHYGYDDALYAALRLIELLSASGKMLSEVVSELPKYHATPEMRIDCADGKKFGVVAAVKEHFSTKHKTITVDGVRIQYDDGWALVRASNTEPKVIFRAEAKSEKRLGEIEKEVLGKLKGFL